MKNGKIFDFKDDIHNVLLDVGRIGIPPYVDLEKVAEEQPETSAGYGLPYLNKYPINTRGNTWLSVYYFEKTAEHLDPDDRKVAFLRITDAAKAWKVKTPAIWTGHTKKANLDDMSDSWVVKNEMTKFAKYKNRIDYREKRRRAKIIIKEASALGVDIPYPEIIMYGSDTPAKRLDDRLESRKRIVKDPDALKAIKAISEMGGTVTVDDLIEILADFDKQMNLEGVYGGKIPDPVITITDTTETNPDPPLITIGDIKFRPDDLASLIGDEMIEAIKVDPDSVIRKNPTLLDVIRKEVEDGKSGR